MLCWILMQQFFILCLHIKYVSGILGELSLLPVGNLIKKKKRKFNSSKLKIENKMQIFAFKLFPQVINKIPFKIQCVFTVFKQSILLVNACLCCQCSIIFNIEFRDHYQSQRYLYLLYLFCVQLTQKYCVFSQ